MTQKLSKFSPRAWSPQDPSLAPRLHKLGKMIFGTTTQTLSELSFQLVKLLPGGPLEYKALTSTWRSSWAPVRRHAIYYREPYSNGFVEKSSKFWRFLQKKVVFKLCNEHSHSLPTFFKVVYIIFIRQFASSHVLSPFRVKVDLGNQAIFKGKA